MADTPSTEIAEPKPDLALGHQGEIAARALFPSRISWDEDSLKGMMRDAIPSGLAQFINSQPFFFLSTASAEGHCDASFKGREYDAKGEALPALLVLGPKLLAFPDYAGNGLYNSLGNIIANPHVGLLFVDFEHQQRARVNGKAQIIAVAEELREIWPRAQSIVLVSVEQAYGNCSARIPQMTMVPQSDMRRRLRTTE